MLAPPPTVSDGPRRVRRIPYKYVVAIVFVSALFVDILDTTIVNVAIPTLRHEFHTSESSIEWVVLGYLLSLAVWIPASGWIGDRFGTRKTFLVALFTFVAASALCGRAGSEHQLIAFRVVQGMGGGMLTPVGTTMLYRAFPPEERVRASTILIIPTVIAPASGPIIGGLLIEHLSWRWIFYVNLPIGVATFVFGAFFLKEHKEASTGPFDPWGFVLSAASLALILYWLSQAPRTGWTSTEAVSTGLIGLVLLAVLVVVELRLEHPMLQLHLFNNRMFRATNIAAIASNGSFIGVLFLLPLFLQDLRGLSALETGLATFPQALGVMLAAQIVGRILPRVGPRRVMMFGLFGAGATLFCFTFVTLHGSIWWVRLLMFVRGLFMAFAVVPQQSATFATITPAETGRASSLFSTQRQMSAAIGVATLATVWLSRTKARVGSLTIPAAVRHARLRGFHDAFIGGAIIAVLGSCAALLIHDEDAAAIMKPKQRP